MNKKEDYIQPTKDAPIFKCYNDYLGYIEDSMYKDWEIHKENLWSVGSTFAIDLTNAILKLHNYIKENKETIAPKSIFSILMIDGSLNKKGEINEKKCYSISMKQAKQFRLI